jgi:hypothetical protein
MGMRKSSPPIAVVGTFAGWKGIPWLRWAHNSRAPYIALDDDQILFRVTRTRCKPYHAIARVDYRKAGASANVVISFADGIATFIADAGAESVARRIVGALADKGCPLSPRAERLAAGSGSSRRRATRTGLPPRSGR